MSTYYLSNRKIVKSTENLSLIFFLIDESQQLIQHVFF